jgi:DNA-binding PadR family transcriptional regulator
MLERGEMRRLVLAILLDGPTHGYAIIRRLQQAVGGCWRPSPGSIYPVLHLLERTGLAECRLEGDRKLYELTAAGRIQADLCVGEQDIVYHAHRSGVRVFWSEMSRLRAAAHQVLAVAEDEELARADRVPR